MYWLGNVFCFVTKLHLKQDLQADTVEMAQWVGCMLTNMKTQGQMAVKSWAWWHMSVATMLANHLGACWPDSLDKAVRSRSVKYLF